MQDIRYVIESDTGKTMDELFEQFDEKPLGAASLAQVIETFFFKYFLKRKGFYHQPFASYSYKVFSIFLDCDLESITQRSE